MLKDIFAAFVVFCSKFKDNQFASFRRLALRSFRVVRKLFPLSGWSVKTVQCRSNVSKSQIVRYNPEMLSKRADIAHLPPSTRVILRGYRSYVGAHTAEQWYAIGRLQYYFLVRHGLMTNHNFLDIGCGSLRLGQYLIPYLERGRYYGLEPEELLVNCGLDYEVPKDIIHLKNPNFSFNYNFEFEGLNTFDYAIANSVLTHLNEADIRLLFRKIASKAHSSSKFYFTFFEGSSVKNDRLESHANKSWYYSFHELQGFACGWRLNYIGDWGHPRNQKMVQAVLQ